MELKNQSDHVAILSLMMVGTLVKRLNETGQLDDPTRKHLRQLVEGVRLHARNAGLDDLRILFDNLDKALGPMADAN
jgi:hypothetical protein